MLLHTVSFIGEISIVSRLLLRLDLFSDRETEDSISKISASTVSEI